MSFYIIPSGFDDHLMKLLSVPKSAPNSKAVNDINKSLEQDLVPTAEVKGFLSMVRGLLK